MIKYITTKEECKNNIRGVCEGCGGELEPIETVDNLDRPTYWIGCRHCNSFRSGIDKKYFEVARELIMEGIIIPYSHLKKPSEDMKDEYEYWLDRQSAGLSFTIEKIDRMLK